MKCYTETWLTDAGRDSHVNIEGFSLFRSDRTKDSCKKIRGGLCLFLNEKWCHRNHLAVKQKVCTPNVEMLTVSVRPYYLPREFPHVLVTTVYVPSSANANDAVDVISSHMHDFETSAPGVFKIITGDFNHCSHKTSTMNYLQHVKVLHRKIVYLTSATRMFKMPTPLCLFLHSDGLTITWSNLSLNIGLWCRGNRLLLALSKSGLLMLLRILRDL